MQRNEGTYDSTSSAEVVTIPSELLSLLSPPGGSGDLREVRVDRALVAPDGRRYSLAAGIPVLLPHGDLSAFSTTLEDEARWYDEADEYSDGVVAISREALVETAAAPTSGYIDALYEYSAQERALSELGSLSGRTVAQIGGSGLHAVKMLMAGASAALTVTPFPREAQIANLLADEFGYSERHLAVVGMGEALPLQDDAFDVLYLGGSLHHLNTGIAAREMARVLRPGGSFAAVDPWRTGVYSLGTRVFGKRERDVSCVPMDPSRVASMREPFAALEATRFHPILRYPLILLQTRTPLKLPRRIVERLLAAETRVESHLPRFARDHGSCVVVVGTKAGA